MTKKKALKKDTKDSKKVKVSKKETPAALPPIQFPTARGMARSLKAAKAQKKAASAPKSAAPTPVAQGPHPLTILRDKVEAEFKSISVDLKGLVDDSSTAASDTTKAVKRRITKARKLVNQIHTLALGNSALVP